MIRKVVLLGAIWMTVSAKRLPDLLPVSFLNSLTPSARERVSEVWAIPVPLMRHPLAFYMPWPNVVVYGPYTDPGTMKHEAMHALDPCHLDPECAAAFAATLPEDLRQIARDLYGERGWAEIEYWPVIPAWFMWDPEQIPIDAYQIVFR